MQCKVETTEVTRLPKHLQVSLVPGKSSREGLPSVFTVCLWWGCGCSLDTECCQWLLLHVQLWQLSLRLYPPVWVAGHLLTLSSFLEAFSFGLSFPISVCLMQLAVLNQTECTATPWCFPKDTSHAAIPSCLFLVNTFSDDMKANSKKTDPKVMAFACNPSSPKRKKQIS